MKKSNIIFFTGENKVFLKKEISKWIDLFISKHGDFNISRFNKDTLKSANIEGELMTPPFLGQFKLIIIEDLPIKQEIKEEIEEEIICPKCNSKNIKISKTFVCSFCKYKEESKTIDDIVMSYLDNIGANNIVLFIQENPDKRTRLYKKLIDIATVKEFNNLSEIGIKDYIRSRLVNIDSSAIKKLIEYKNSSINKIDKEIDKLELFKSNERITEEDIIKYIIPEIEISIFNLTDALFELNQKKALESLNSILETNNIFQVFSSIVSNLRSFLYIHFLLKKYPIKDKVIRVLAIHPYVFEKAVSYKNSQDIIYKLFENLVKIDRKVKIGELIGEGENSIKLALEKEILNLKN